MALAPKRKFCEDVQLPTPHASSSAYCAPSSPLATHRVPQYVHVARPDGEGHWLSIGRSSISSQLALPSSNRLISRTHAKIRYVAGTNDLEVQCTGYNGMMLYSQGQSIYINHNTSISMQIQSSLPEIEISMCGTLVKVELPHAQDSQLDESLVPMPSSPVLGETALREDETGMSMPSPIQSSPAMCAMTSSDAICDTSALSPLPSSTGMLTPGGTPSAQRTQDKPKPSPLVVFADEEIESAAKAALCTTLNAILQPRKLNFESELNSSTESFESEKTSFQLPGKENLPPAKLEIKNPVESSPRVEQSKEQDAAVKNLDELSGETKVTEAASDEITVDSSVIWSAADRTEQQDTAELKASEATITTISTPANDASIDSHCTTLQADQVEDAVDPEFIDMILSALASAPVSPAPISHIAPFFPPDTATDTIERFLRSVDAICEVERHGKDASGKGLRSTWYYEPHDDGDAARRARLQGRMKPIRTTRKQHVQYYWKPVHLKSPVTSSGLIERPKKRVRAKRT